MIGETVMTVFTKNKMVQKRDAEQFRAMAKTLREQPIFGTRSEITGRNSATLILPHALDYFDSAVTVLVMMISGPGTRKQVEKTRE